LEQSQLQWALFRNSPRPSFRYTIDLSIPTQVHQTYAKAHTQTTKETNRLKNPHEIHKFTNLQTYKRPTQRLRKRNTAKAQPANTTTTIIVPPTQNSSNSKPLSPFAGVFVIVGANVAGWVAEVAGEGEVVDAGLGS
jgi:hypothetical protein